MWTTLSPMYKYLILLLLTTPSFALAIKQIHCPGPGREMMVADPAIVPAAGSVLVMGTGDILKWKNLDALISGSAPQREHLTLFKEVTIGDRQVVMPMSPPELPWDLQFYTLNGEAHLYGGLMSPLPNVNDARWPEDNISRRIKVATFDKKLKGWVFKEAPVFGKVDHQRWPGHSYGQQMAKHQNKFFMLHEEISRDGVTEIFIRQMITPAKAGAAKKIISIEHLKPEKTVRVDGGHLLEGPRHTVINGLHYIFFSTGDFPTKNYATRVAYSFNIEGPYKVIEDQNGAIDLTLPAQKLGLYGVGRAFPFKYQGKDWIIFHGARDIPGVDHRVWPSNLDRFQRCLFAAPIKIQNTAGKIQMSLI